MRWSLLLVVTACGRIGFDPLDGVTTDGATMSGDGSGSGDGGVPGDSATVVPGDNCASARPIAIGEVLSAETIAGANNDYLGSICGNGPEVVYRFTQPTNNASRQVDILATFTGSVWITAACPPTLGSCQSFNANQPYSNMTTLAIGTQHLVIDKVSGAGTSFTLSLQ